MKKLLPLILFVFFAGCDDSPRIYGPSTFAIGQKVTVTLTQGSELVESEFRFTDSSGKVFTPDDDALEYEYLGKNKFSFRVPAGVVSGDATLEMKGKTETYKINFRIIRGIIWSDGSGVLSLSDIDEPSSVFKTMNIGTGDNIIRVVDEKSRIVILSPETGQIDYLMVDSKDYDTFGVYATSITLQSTTQGVNASPTDVLAIDNGLVVSADRGICGVKILTIPDNAISFDSWIYSEGEVRALDISDSIDENGTKVIAAAGLDANDFSILMTFNSLPFPRTASDKNIVILSEDDSTVSDVSISPDAVYAAAVIPSSDSLYLVNTSTSNVVKTTLSDCLSPTHVDFVNAGERIAVLCSGSDTVQLFDVNGTTPTHFKTITAGSSTNHVSGMFYSSDEYVWVSLAKGGLVYLDSTSSNPVLNSLEGSDSIKSPSFVIQP
ncbi:MAG: hypothetical protein JXR95_09100 [Deltaproteobacteria bacterium]|nr:hypothetical protein [Deltaproteobacteria bacterium]